MMAYIAHARPVLQLNTQAAYYKWLVAGTVLLAGATQTFAGNSINLAIPHLMAAFGTDLATTQWVATGFLIARTLMVPVLGWLGGFLGNRNLFVAIMIGFILTSIGCGLATDISVLILCRLAQGLVLGPIEGLTAVLMVQAFPPQQRGMAIGLRSIGWAAGQIISFTVGGYCLEQLSWRMLFFLGIPSGILAACLGLWLLPQERQYRGIPVDYPGLLALALFLVPLILDISLARQDETELSTLLLLGLATLLGGGLFIARELLTPFPAVNIRLFGVPAFCWLACTSCLNTLGLFGAQFMIPIFLQQVMGYTALQAGLVIVPALLVAAVGGTLAGRLSDLISPRLMILAALALLTVVFQLFATVSALTTGGVLVGYVILYRVCLFSIQTPETSLNVQILGPEQLRMGQGLLGTVRNIGAALGVTVSSVIFERRRAYHQVLSYTDYNSAAAEHLPTVRAVASTLHSAGIVEADIPAMTVRALQQQLDTEAVAAGFRDSFCMISLFFLLAMLPLLGVRVARERQPRRPAA
ncbi:MAG: DHA2 family efflux MFS transporter permease subunit [Candidatus Tectimicrobiota bacterium]